MWMPILAKKSSFQINLIFDLGRYVNKQNYRIWGTETPHACIVKPTHPKRVTIFCGLDNFSSKMSKERPLQPIEIVIAPCWTNLFSQKFKRRILATFGFNRTALRATQPKQHSMFCALFLKIELSAAELIKFGHLLKSTILPVNKGK